MQILFGEETVSWHHVCPQSPDLNPIELLGTSDVRKKCPTSENHLWTILQDAWSNISSQCLNKLTAWMPRLCRAVIAANGGYFDESKILVFSMYKLCCFRSLRCPLSVHKLKRIHANIVQNPTFLGRFIGCLYIYIFNQCCFVFFNCILPLLFLKAQ